MLSRSLFEISAELEFMHYYLLLFRIHLLLLLLLLVLLLLLLLLLLLISLLLFRILYCASQSKKKKDCSTTYDVQTVCLTIELKVCLIEPKYEQQVSRL